MSRILSTGDVRGGGGGMLGRGGGMHGKCFIFVFRDIYVLITKAFGLPKPSLFCNVQRDVASLPSYSKLNSKHNHWNSM